MWQLPICLGNLSVRLMIACQLGWSHRLDLTRLECRCLIFSIWNLILEFQIFWSNMDVWYLIWNPTYGTLWNLIITIFWSNIGIYVGFHRVPLVLIHLNWIFPYKPSSYWGTPIYGNPHIDVCILISWYIFNSNTILYFNSFHGCLEYISHRGICLRYGSPINWILIDFHLIDRLAL